MILLEGFLQSYKCKYTEIGCLHGAACFFRNRLSLNWLRNSSPFMKLKGSYAEPHNQSTHSHIFLCISILILFFSVSLKSPTGLFLWGFQIQNSVHFSSSPWAQHMAVVMWWLGPGSVPAVRSLKVQGRRRGPGWLRLYPIACQEHFWQLTCQIESHQNVHTTDF